MLPVSLDCPFLIALSVFSNVYLDDSRMCPTAAIYLPSFVVAVRSHYILKTLCFRALVSLFRIYISQNCKYLNLIWGYNHTECSSTRKHFGQISQLA
jgi:hypothetical protein